MSQFTVTLLSDLGAADASVSIAETLLMQRLPEAVIVSLSNSVMQYDLRQAACLLLSAYKHFSQGTIHVVTIDVFNGDHPRILLAEKEGHFFIAPDNGMLPIAFGPEMESPRMCFECAKPYLFREWISKAGEIIGAVRSGSYVSFPSCDMMKAPWLLQHKPVNGGLECNILCTDRFGNVLLDITRPQFDEIVDGKPFAIKVLKTMEITSISDSYTDVPPGDPLCRFNTSGFLEIALNHGSAAAYLGLGAYGAGMHYPPVRIFF